MNSADKIRAEQIRSAKESRCQAGASGDLIARAKTLQSTFSGVRDDPLAHTWVTRYRSLIAAVKHLSPRVDPRPIETPRGDNGGHVRSVVALRANTRVWAKAWSPTQGPGNIWSFWSDLDQRPWINLQNLSKWMSYKYLKPVRGECVCGARRYNLYYLFRQHMNFKAGGQSPQIYQNSSRSFRVSQVGPEEETESGDFLQSQTQRRHRKTSDVSAAGKSHSPAETKVICARLV